MTVFFAGNRTNDIPPQPAYEAGGANALPYPPTYGAQVTSFCAANSLYSRALTDVAFHPDSLTAETADGGFTVTDGRLLFGRAENGGLYTELFVYRPDGTCVRRNQPGEERLDRGRHVLVLTAEPRPSDRVHIGNVVDAVGSVTHPRADIDLDHADAGPAIAHDLIRRTNADGLSVLVTVLDIQKGDAPRRRLPLRHRLGLVLGTAAAAGVCAAIFGLTSADETPATAPPAAEVSQPAPAAAESTTPKEPDKTANLAAIVAAIAAAGVATAQIRVLLTLGQRQYSDGPPQRQPLPAPQPRAPIAETVPVVPPQRPMIRQRMPNEGAFDTLNRSNA